MYAENTHELSTFALRLRDIYAYVSYHPFDFIPKFAQAEIFMITKANYLDDFALGDWNFL